MLSEHERQELVGLVAKECGTVLSPDDPIFASVVMSERVLEHAASAVASRLARHLEASFAAQEDQVGRKVGDAVNTELHRLMVAGGRARKEIRQNGRRWTTALALTAILGLLSISALQWGAWP
jgi:hypothetical protein